MNHKAESCNYRVEKEYSVIANQISKKYKIYKSQREKLLDFILPIDRGKDFYALKNISFAIEKGDCVGFLGLNGSGKSTLARIISGVSQPTSGKLYIKGNADMITISSGLNQSLTGIENIELKGMMIGLEPEQIEVLKEDIIAFADVGAFIYQPVKTYSSGMKSRLGFAISVNINPDILIVDEALAVGDMTFTQKCFDRMNRFREEGKTIIFVSHSISQVRNFCNKALWLEYGMLHAYGDVEEIAPVYDEFIKRFQRMNEQEKAAYKKKNILIQKSMSGV